MKKQVNLLNLKKFAVALVCCFAFSNVCAASTSAAEKLAVSLLTNDLSARLKTDLAKTDVTVELGGVEQREVSKNTIEIKGDGVCLFDKQNERLPLRFEAKINVAQKTVSSVSYDFIETSDAESAPADYAPTSNEEFMVKELMKQVSRDYKTENIVVALDAVEGTENSKSEKRFSGYGEIRIGDLQWNKIKFDVTVDESGKTKKVVYDVKK